MTASMDQVVSVMTATTTRIVPDTKLKVVAKYLENMKNNVCLEALASAKAARRMLIVPLTNGSIKHVVIRTAFKEKVAWANTYSSHCASGETCCSSKCKKGFDCIGESCSSYDDCNGEGERCCKGKCSKGECDQVNDLGIIIGSVVGGLVFAICITICSIYGAILRRRRLRRLLETSITTNITTTVTTRGDGTEVITEEITISFGNSKPVTQNNPLYQPEGPPSNQPAEQPPPYTETPTGGPGGRYAGMV